MWLFNPVGRVKSGAGYFWEMDRMIAQGTRVCSALYVQSNPKRLPMLVWLQVLFVATSSEYRERDETHLYVSGRGWQLLGADAATDVRLGSFAQN